jgi:TonB dependent receptor-like, beta-barrel/Carboxypeptidase regulatory-like domain/TonB-dependent Receptor Plug Domain
MSVHAGVPVHAPGFTIPRTKVMQTLSIVLALLLLAASMASHAAVFGSVRGIVHDAEHRPMSAASIELKSATSSAVQSTQTDAQGRFAFASIALGDYTLSVRADGFVRAVQSITVVSGVSPVAHFQLMRGTQLETVTVTSTATTVVPEAVTPTTLVNSADIARTPGASRSNSTAMITNFVPGAYMVHDQLHIRGGHQTLWAIDGVEIPNTNIASNLGPQIDPKDIDYLEIERGSYQADQGDRTYGVFNVVPRTGFGRDNQGDLLISGGNYAQTNDYLSIGSHTQDFAYYVSVNGNRSDLGLETPVSRILHDSQQGYGAFSTFIFNADPDNQLRLVTSIRRDDYEIPISPGDLTNDVQREADAFAILSWIRTFSPDAVLTSSLLYHYNRANLDAASTDYPISTTDRRSSDYVGGQETLRLHFDRSDLLIGVFGFSQQDHHTFEVLFNDGSNPDVHEALNPSGGLVAAYLQETFRATQRLTLTAGVRQTHFDGILTENATSPRVGATYRVPGLDWILRAFYGRYYQPPPLETLSGPLVQYAQNSNLAFLPLRGERDSERQFGLTIPLSGWTIDTDYFRTAASNFFDHNPIGESNVFFPITIEGALIRGWELTVRSPRFWNVGQFHLAWSNQTANGFGAVTGGLTDFSPDGGFFALDHDQRNTVNAGIDTNLPWQSFVSANLYYGSGFANGEAPPSHLPGHASLDLTLGKAFTTALSASVTVLNVTDRHLLIDNSLTFGGFHYDNPREIYAELHYNFNY